MSGSDWMVSVHCDWEKCLEADGGSAWLLCKERGRPAVSSKLRRTAAGLECEEENWAVEAVSPRVLRVSLAPARTVYLLAPSVSYKLAGRVTSLDVSRGGLGVYSAGGDSVSVWDTQAGTVRRDLAGHLGEVYHSKLFPSGVVALTAGADMRLKVWNVQTGDCPVTLAGHTGPVTATAIVSRGKNVISVSKDGTARLWSCGQAKCLGVLLTLTENINCCHLSDSTMFHPLESAPPSDPAEVETEDKVLAVGGEEGTVSVLSVSSRALLQSFSVGSPVNALLLTEDKLYVGCQDGGVHIISQAGTEVVRASSSPVLCMMRLEATDEVVISRQDGSVTVYMAGGRLELTGSDTDPVYCLAQDDRNVYTGCRDGAVRKYDMTDLVRLVKLCNKK